MKLAMELLQAGVDRAFIELCRKLGVTRQTLYRYVSPSGTIRADGKKLLKKA